MRCWDMHVGSDNHLITLGKAWPYPPTIFLIYDSTYKNPSESRTQVHPERWKLCARAEMGVRVKKLEVMHNIDTKWSSIKSMHWALYSLSLCRCGVLACHGRVRCRSGKSPKSTTPHMYPCVSSYMANNMMILFVHCPVVYNDRQIIAKGNSFVWKIFSLKKAEWQDHTLEQEEIFGTLIECSSCQAGRHRPEQ